MESYLYLNCLNPRVSNWLKGQICLPVFCLACPPTFFKFKFTFLWVRYAFCISPWDWSLSIKGWFSLLYNQPYLYYLFILGFYFFITAGIQCTFIYSIDVQKMFYTLIITVFKQNASQMNSGTQICKLDLEFWKGLFPNQISFLHYQKLCNFCFYVAFSRLHWWGPNTKLNGLQHSLNPTPFGLY